MSERTLLITGGNGFIGKRILENYLNHDMEIVLLTQDKFMVETQQLIETWKSIHGTRARLRAVRGDITMPGLGLSRDDLAGLADTVTDAIHLAAAYNLAIRKSVADLINVQGTRNTMELFSELPSLRRLAYMSTTSITGTHEGIFTEDDFDTGQKFKNYYESTKFKAEAIVREYMEDIPTVIFRPTIVVGDSKTGEIEKIDGPYYAFVMISRSLHVAVQRSGDVCFHIAPVDFVTNAFYTIFEKNNAPGRVYHLGDPEPMRYDDFFDLVCEKWGRFKPLLRFPPKVMEALLKAPGMGEVFGVLPESFPYTYTNVSYSFDNAQRMLNGSGLRCPQVPEYIDVMIDYFVNHLDPRRLKKHRW